MMVGGGGTPPCPAWLGPDWMRAPGRAPSCSVGEPLSGQPSFPLEEGLVSPRTMYRFMYRRPLDMYLDCISSVVFGALGRLVSLCIVSLRRHVSLPVPGAFICSVFKPVGREATEFDTKESWKKNPT